MFFIQVKIFWEKPTQEYSNGFEIYSNSNNYLIFKYFSYHFTSTSFGLLIVEGFDCIL